jgi:hypothetical protein
MTLVGVRSTQPVAPTIAPAVGSIIGLAFVLLVITSPPPAQLGG